MLSGSVVPYERAWRATLEYLRVLMDVEEYKRLAERPEFPDEVILPRACKKLEKPIPQIITTHGLRLGTIVRG
jgi:hypothetical protein